MALLPPIPARPTDRPEIFDEYRRRRSILVMWRHFNDDLAAWLRRDPPPPFDPFDWFYQGAPYRGFRAAPAPRSTPLPLRPLG
jgi:hypothetical protein